MGEKTDNGPATGGIRAGSRSVGSALRGAGRMALWGAVCLLLVRGAADLLRGPVEVPHAPRRVGLDRELDAFAVRYARAYLANPSPRALNDFLATGARVGAGRPPSALGAEVAQAEIVRSTPLGDGRFVLTVACELRDSRTLYLAVPIVRRKGDEVAALGAPSLVAVPAVAGVAPERPRPLIGPSAGPIGSLIAKFLPAYLAARRSSDLAYLMAPGSTVIPLGGALETVGPPRAAQLGDGEGRRRTVLASIRARDPESGAVYPLVYRLRVVERGRWYVERVEGALP